MRGLPPTIAYDLNGDGTLDFTRVLDRSQDPLNRDQGWELKNNNTVENEVEYGYDIAGRLSTVADAANTFTYGYQYNQTAATAPRIGSTTGSKQDYMPYTLTKSGSPTLETLRTYEARRNALTTIQNNAGSIPRSSYTYTVNPFGQRTDLTTAFDLGIGHVSNPGDTDWGYDSLGQLKTAAAPGTDADRYFAYDAIGNRLESRAGTATNSGGTLTEYFGKLTPSLVAGANDINQYVGIKKGSTTIEPGYDDDGNATDYPVPAFPGANSALVWDAENRLISTSVNSVTTTHLYDAQSRKFATTTGSTTTLYIYDGWNCIAEYTGISLAKTRIWGMDLSGAMQGAGGVGGLLAEKQGSDYFYPTYDGNGNISEYLAADGTTTAHFEYDAFGNTVIDTDTNNQFAYRFSTKPLDQTTGFYYYTYRHYDPVTGRWPSRDPIEEAGGINLYNFAFNNGVIFWDYLGQEVKVGDPLVKRNLDVNQEYEPYPGGRPSRPSSDVLAVTLVKYKTEPTCRCKNPDKKKKKYILKTLVVTIYSEINYLSTLTGDIKDFAEHSEQDHVTDYKTFAGDNLTKNAIDAVEQRQSADNSTANDFDSDKECIKGNIKAVIDSITLQNIAQDYVLRTKNTYDSVQKNGKPQLHKYPGAGNWGKK